MGNVAIPTILFLATILVAAFIGYAIGKDS